MKNYPYILFDLDGMVLCSDEGVFNCINHALTTLGYPPPTQETLKKFMGPPLLYSFINFSGLSEEQAQQALRLYRERYSTVGMFEAYIFDGIEELLKALKLRGVMLGTATSKPEEFTKKILEKFGIAKYFDIITGATFDKSRESKEKVVEEALRRFGNPDKSDVLLVGDRKYDTEGAHKVGIKCCGVYMECAEQGEHEAAGADYITHGVKGLTELLLR